MSFDMNRVNLTANLTADPELRSTPGGTAVCNLRVACNTGRKVGEEWISEPNYFDVTVWGASAENAARFLKKGRGVAIDGKLRWREWETEDGSKRQAVYIVADQLIFLSDGKPSAEPDGSAQGSSLEPAQEPVAA
jgi:single-strand DNA-binding protein